MKSTALVATFAILLSGCLTPKITRRYESRELTTATNPAYGPSLTAFATDVPVATPQTTLVSLSDGGQAALIRELGAKAADADGLIRLLGTPILGPKVPLGTVDLTVFERRVVLSVENRSTKPGDRLNRVVMILKPSPPGEFVSWNQFVTRYQTINLGTIELTQSREAGIGLTAGPPTASVTGSAKEVQNLREELNLSQRFVAVTGTLTPTEARAVEEGAFGIDLTGNTIVDFTVRVGKDSDHKEDYTFSFFKLFDDNDAPLSASSIKFDRQTVKYVLPNKCQEITASTQLLSTLRLIDRNDATIMEGDDRARYESITSTPGTFTLIPKELLRANVWSLEVQDQLVHLSPSSVASDGRGPEIRPNEPTNEPLFFRSYVEAASFLRYLSRIDPPYQVGDRPLLRPQGLEWKPLTKDFVDMLQVKIHKLNWESSPCT